MIRSRNVSKRVASIWFILLSLFISGCSRDVYVFSSFHEPADEGLRLLYSYDGYKWNDLNHVFLKPGVGEQKIMRDPSMARGPDGTYHLVWTTGWKGTKGFGYARSKDLIHWTDERSIEVMAKEPETVNVWAPELFYDDEGRQFIIIWASTIPFRFPKGQEEENNNHRMYYTTTKDFKTFSETKLFLDPGFSVIDCVILKEAKGKYVLVLKDNTRPNRNIRVAFSDNPLGPYTNVSEPFTAKLTEGPAVVHPGKEWLIYYDSYGTKKYGAARTYDFKTFEDVSNQVQVPEGHKHGTIFKVTRAQLKTLKKEAGK
ncbi:glycosyl hydrolase family 43 [Arcticibacter tournemirensis]|uniref:Family 43 glycosylhydrolase n=1 Tax=Arcticibacter tournemirensis TaxID=699437 RepID=A0A5M9HHT8_9SPHI|nr:glycoside hydrolase family 43 protein [Arcticibacter tournemirensis]KAA8486290.1 family 43 glycosylhydrolase [Arcticibacter tournemirensis]TQM52099.1 glycosyl hydrolase family 43 [Arcticibacter tournemirensis]